MRKKYTDEFKAQIVLEIFKEEKSVTQLASEHGIHPTQLTRWKNEAIQNLPSLFTDDRKGVQALKKTYESKIDELYAEVGRLTTQNTWLKKKLASALTRSERNALVDWDNPELPIKTQAELLSLNRTSLYYKPVPPSPEEISIKHLIDEIYTKYPYYGSRRIQAVLNKKGVIINRKAVQRHMREMGIQGICPGPNLSKRDLQHRIYPYLLRGVKITHPNQVWSLDITYIRMKYGWMYLVAIIDWYSRYILSWELDQSLEISFVLRAVNKALAQAQPEIMNSDQGSQFTSIPYIELLQNAGAKISMDGKCRALDNIFIERVWRSLKWEDIFLKNYETPREVRHGVNNWFQTYNYGRPHQSLKYQTPAQVYFESKEVMTIDSVNDITEVLALPESNCFAFS
ncbi:IS3 family transposase [Syntrophomonas wolfei]|uniref:IS3 family transposase n=1 Tax=Syntrophomonas wolfei TaxID=863 RepID=UPI001F609F36|nr:IS3 family transposase [Syntrophomonas wolfei]